MWGLTNSTFERQFLLKGTYMVFKQLNADGSLLSQPPLTLPADLTPFLADPSATLLHPGWVKLKYYTLQEFRDWFSGTLDPQHPLSRLMQKSHFLEAREFGSVGKGLFAGERPLTDKTWFEKMMDHEALPRKSISLLYLALTTPLVRATPHYLRTWEAELHTSLRKLTS